ncbi:divalent-cation tolerance protein CutA [Sphingomonas ginkgonis]|uniref:Divalent-cation tolerance protein CutA n=1 Tax=Sphingomonas ginkgonis TaxID=2315330 RepID=A0A3S0EM03_9SPHN|nr:divalent-cation tolerance protein CutA [Sphingomonas ginkgonis]RST30601.1 divalent-cation tolerance protein CutA [Sphingomonas ginkgonis]
MTVVSVYCVFASAEEAERIGRTVIEQRLAACINILPPCRSIYRWNGAIETAQEVPAILKTSADLSDRLMTTIAGLHSYAVPAITVWPVEKLLSTYADWVTDSTTG